MKKKRLTLSIDADLAETLDDHADEFNLSKMFNDILRIELHRRNIFTKAELARMVERLRATKPETSKEEP